MSKDYYQILGVNKTASDDEIKKSYRKLAMKFHPDRVSSLSDAEKKTAEEKFKEVQEAYAVLSDPEKKHMYDRVGHDQFRSAGSGGGGFSGFGGFEDIFESFGDMFGGGGRNRSSKGNNLEYQITITLEESASSCEKSITFPRTETCGTCEGRGSKNPSDLVVCKTCKGHGQIRFSQGMFSIQQTCNDCHGAGKIIKHPCSQCRGSGVVKQQKTIKINIPAGVEDGSTLRVANEGEAGYNGGGHGDLYVHITIKPHKIFTRNGKDLHIEIPINFITAVLGGEISVPTLSNKTVKLKIPEGTQTNSNLRIKDHGIKSLRSSSHGDLYCHIIVETPVNLTEPQKELLRKFDELSGGNYASTHSPRSKSFLDKLRDLFHSDD